MIKINNHISKLAGLQYYDRVQAFFLLCVLGGIILNILVKTLLDIAKCVSIGTDSSAALVSKLVGAVANRVFSREMRNREKQEKGFPFPKSSCRNQEIDNSSWNQIH